ncbi:hypothetical protein ACMHYB_52440 [Sorangium sp. So ce1128]
MAGILDRSEWLCAGYPHEKLCLTCGGVEEAGAGYMAAEELPSRRLLWLAHFSFSGSFLKVKYGDDSLLADAEGGREWKFPMRDLAAFSVRAGEDQGPARPSPIEPVFQARYPQLCHFLQTTLWPDVDGFNAIALLHQAAFFSPPETARRLIAELRALSADPEIRGEEVSGLLNQEDIDHPYRVVTPANAKDFCYSMQESMELILSLKK